MHFMHSHHAFFAYVPYAWEPCVTRIADDKSRQRATARRLITGVTLGNRSRCRSDREGAPPYIWGRSSHSRAVWLRFVNSFAYNFVSGTLTYH